MIRKVVGNVNELKSLGIDPVLKNFLDSCENDCPFASCCPSLLEDVYTITEELERLLGKGVIVWCPVIIYDVDEGG